MIEAIREAIAFPFYLVALVFIWLDAFIMGGFDYANEAIVYITSEEE